MRTIHRYIAWNFIVTFVISLTVITFVMTIGGLLKLTPLLSRGVPAGTVLTLLLSGFPEALKWSIPVGCMISSLLVFGRLSADSEISAMKACGIGMWQIVLTPVAVGAVMTALCVWINCDMAPRSHYARRSLVVKMGMENPVAMIEEGRFVEDFEDYLIYVRRKRGNSFRDVRIYDTRKPDMKSEIFAASATISVEGDELVLDLRNVRIDPVQEDRTLLCEQFPKRIPLPTGDKAYRKKEKDMTMSELSHVISSAGEMYGQLGPETVEMRRMAAKAERSTRWSLSFSCLAFVLLGVPLGIRTHRKESSIGVVVSLFLLLGFYLFVIIGWSLADRPEFRPDILVLLPVFLFISLGVWLVERGN